MPTTSVICSQPDVCTWTTCQILQSCWFKIFCSSRFIKSRYTVKCENIYHLLYHLHLIDYQNWIRKIIESDYICWTTWREVFVNMLRANWRHLLKLRCQILNKAWRRTNLHHSKDHTFCECRHTWPGVLPFWHHFSLFVLETPRC